METVETHVEGKSLPLTSWWVERSQVERQRQPVRLTWDICGCPQRGGKLRTEEFWSRGCCPTAMQDYCFNHCLGAGPQPPWGEAGFKSQFAAILPHSLDGAGKCERLTIRIAESSPGGRGEARRGGRKEGGLCGCSRHLTGFGERMGPGSTAVRGLGI